MTAHPDQPFGLSFETEDDSLNHSSELVKRGQDSLISEPFVCVGETDLRVELVVHFEWRSQDHLIEFELTIAPIFNADPHDAPSGTEEVESPAKAHLDWNKVFVWIGDESQASEDVIPILLAFGRPPRLERHQLRVQSSGDVFVSLAFSAFESAPKFLLGLSKREGKVLDPSVRFKRQHAA